MDVQDDTSQRVLSVAIVKASRPRDGVVANEFVVRVPEGKVGVENEGGFYGKTTTTKHNKNKT